MLPYPDIPDLETYCRVFTDAAFWRPCVAAICARYDLPCAEVRAGLPGTNPVLLVDGRYVVKLYPAFFDGARSFAAERAVYARLARDPVLPAPVMVAEGALFQGRPWHYPYLVTTLIPGQSAGEAALGPADRLALAAYVGEAARRLHALPVAGLVALGDFTAFIQARRAACAADQAAWGHLPPHLIAGLDAYLPPADAIAAWLAPPRLIHADLTRDHVLGDWVDGRWTPTGIIDFGDARVGDPAYELVALHLDLFAGDKALLRAFLAAHGGFQPGADFVHRAMTLTLLHQFDVLGGLPPERLDAPDLAALAASLWDVDAEG